MEFLNTSDNINAHWGNKAEQKWQEGISKQETKVLDAHLSLSNKAALAEKNLDQKYDNLEGIEQGVLTGSADADTFNLTLQDGTAVSARLASNKGYFLDAVETQHGDNSVLNAVNSNPYKRTIQPQLVSQILNKSVNDLTDDDYNLVGTQAQSSILNSLRGDGTGNLNGWQEGETIPVKYKVMGYDNYGRALVELINPSTRQAVSENFAANPNLNAAWTTGQVFNTQGSPWSKNKDPRFQELLNTEIRRRTQEDGEGLTGRLAESGDIIKSAGYQSAMRFLNLIDKGTELATGDRLLSQAFETDYKAKASAEEGQLIADAWAGVARSTREDQANEMQKASDAWDKGDYSGAIIGWTKQLDRILAESAPTMGLSIAGMAATGGTSLAARMGGSLMARIGSAAIGQTLAAADMTLSSMEQYKANNNNQDMDAKDIASLFSLNLLSLIPGTFLTGVQFAKHLPKPVAKIFTDISKETGKGVLGRVGLVAAEAGEEFLQETLQTSLDTYYSQNQENKQAFGDILTTEGIKGGVQGALAGGALATAGNITVLPSMAYKGLYGTVDQLAKLQKNREEYSFTGEKANTEFSNLVKDNISKLDNSTESLGYINQTLDDPSLSIDVRIEVLKKRHEIRTQQLKETGSTDISPEEFLKDTVFYSDPYGEWDTQGKVSSDETGSRLRQITKVAKTLNPDMSNKEVRELVKQTVDEVTQDAQLGIRSYGNTEDIRNQINAINANMGVASGIDLQNLEAQKNSALRTLLTKTQGSYGRLQSIVNITEEIASGNRTEGRVANTGYTVQGANLYNDSVRSGRGTHGVIQRLNADIQSALQVLTDNGITVENTPIMGELHTADTKLKDYYRSITRLRTNRDAESREAPSGPISKVVSKILGQEPVDTTVSEIIPDNIRNGIPAAIKSYLKNPTKDMGRRWGNLRAKYSPEAWQAYRDDYASSTNMNSAVLASIDDLLLTHQEARDFPVEQPTQEAVEQNTDTSQETTESPEDTQKVKNNPIVSTARKLFTGLNAYLDRMEAAKNIVADFEGTDKSSDITTLLEQYSEAFKNYEANYRNALIHEELMSDVEKEYAKVILPIERELHTLITSVPNEVSKSFLNAQFEDEKTGKVFPGLSDEMEVSSTANSILGSVPLDEGNPLIASIIKVFNTLTPKNDAKGKPISNILNYFNSNTDALTRSPQLRLLYRVEEIKGKPQFMLNTEVAVAVDMALRDYFTSTDINRTFSPYKTEDVQRTFGNDTDILKARAFNRVFGIPQTVIATRIGQDILNNLGIKAKKDGTRGFDSLLAAALGAQALQYARSKGWVDLVTVEAAPYVDENGKASTSEDAIANVMTRSSYGTAMVQYRRNLDDNNVDLTMKKIKTGKDILDNLKLESTDASKPSPTPQHFDEDMGVRNTNGLMKVPAFVKGVMKKLFRTPYVVNHELVDFVRENRDWVAKELGKLTEEEIAGYPLDYQPGLVGVNRSIDKQIDDLLEVDTWNTPYLYFKWFFSRNGRVFMDSTHVNTQQNKALQRYLVTPKDSKTTFNKADLEQMQEFYFTIAQAFDNVKTDSQIADFVKGILEIPADTLWQQFKEGTLKGSKIGSFKVDYENFSQVMLTLQAIRDYQNTPEDGSFDTYLGVENDSTTSGYAITFLQHPNRHLQQMFPKVGILDKGKGLPLTEMHNLKKQKFNDELFLDIYETIASRVVLPEDFSDIELPDGDKKNVLNVVGAKNIDKIFKLIRDALPKPNPDGTISSGLRTLVKSPTMTANYGQGRYSLTRSMGNDLSVKLITDFVQTMDKNTNLKEDEQAKVKAIFTYLLDNIEGFDGDLYDLSERIKTTSLSKLKVKTGGKYSEPISDYLATVIGATYGNAVFSALDATFGEELKIINASKNMMANTMFDLFEEEYNYEVSKKKASLKPGEKYTNTMEDEIIQNLFEVIPTVRLLYDEMLESGVFFMRTERAVDPSNTVQARYDLDGKGSSTSVSANIRKFRDARAAGSIMLTHFIDGMTMAMTLDKYGNKVLPIHDAIQGSGVNSREAIRDFNKNLYEVNQQYDAYGNLVERFNDVLTGIIERRKESGRDVDNVLSASIHQDDAGTWSTYFSKREGKKTVPISREELLDKVDALAELNRSNREEFYNDTSTERYIANVDGVSGSGYMVDKGVTLDDAEFAKGIEDNKDDQSILGSDPLDTWTPNGKITYFEQTNISPEGQEVETRVDIAQAVHKLEGYRTSPEHMNHLLDVIVSRINPKRLLDMTATVEGNTRTTGFIKNKNINVGIDDRSSLDTESGLSPKSLLTAVEVYAHELVHAGSRIPIMFHKDTGHTKEVFELLDIMEQVKGLVPVETFMPPKGSYPEALENDYREVAQRTWNYIFNNPDSTKLRGVQEFLAYALTYRPLMDILERNYTKPRGVQDKLKVLDRVIYLAKTLLDFFKGKSTIGEMLQVSKGALSGKVGSLTKDTLLNEVLELNNKIQGINQKAINKLKNNTMNRFQDLFTAVGNLIRRGNVYLSPKAKYLFNIADSAGFHYKVSFKDIHGSTLKPAKVISWLLALPFSKSRRDYFLTALNRSANISQQSAFASIWRDVSQPDKATAQLEALARNTRSTEMASKSIESTVYTTLKQAFGRELTDDESRSLTQSILYTDLSALADVVDGKITNLDEIITYLQDRSALQDKINALEDTLRKMVPSRNQLNWYFNASMGLANFMVNGTALLSQPMNALNIARGNLSGTYFQATPEIVKTIDQYISLLALSITDPQAGKLASTLSKKGLNSFMIARRNFDEDSRSKYLISPVHEVKGYTKTVTDNSISIEVAPLENRKEMEQEGYTLVRELGNNKISGRMSLGLFRRTWNPSQRRDGAAMIILGSHAMGTSLRESAYAMANDLEGQGIVIDPKEILLERKLYADKLADQTVKLMLSRRLDIDELRANISSSGGYSAIVGMDGEAVDYRVTMSTAEKVNLLGLNQDGLSLLSKMYATNNTKADASMKNQMVVDYLEQDMILNMDSQSHMNSEGKEYVKIEKDTDNQFLKEAYNALPKELLEKANSKEGLWVRNDWLQQILGVPSISLADARAVNKFFGPIVRKGLMLAEYIIKHITYLAKQNIVMKVPTVLLGNIVSNINISIARGRNPGRVIAKQIENAKYIRDYIDARKQRDAAVFKQKLGTATKTELESINDLNTRLEHNPLKPLMDAGMYTAIIEDISPNELDSIGKINKLLSTRFKAMSKPFKTMFKHLYMLEGTPIYDFMFQATQYSDFVARATEYQFQMEEVSSPKLRNGNRNTKYIPKFITDATTSKKVYNPAYTEYENRVVEDIWNTFINYDKPQSSLEQYLNDMGLLMFTKFFKRIQHVILKDLSDNPVSALLFLASQAAIVDTSDIFETQFPTMRGLGNNSFNPIDNLINATIPIPIQMITETGVYQ